MVPEIERAAGRTDAVDRRGQAIDQHAVDGQTGRHGERERLAAVVFQFKDGLALGAARVVTPAGDRLAPGPGTRLGAGPRGYLGARFTVGRHTARIAVGELDDRGGRLVDAAGCRRQFPQAPVDEGWPRPRTPAHQHGAPQHRRAFDPRQRHRHGLVERHRARSPDGDRPGGGRLQLDEPRLGDAVLACDLGARRVGRLEPQGSDRRGRRLQQRPFDRVADRFRKVDDQGIEHAGTGQALEREGLGKPALSRRESHLHAGIERGPPRHEAGVAPCRPGAARQSAAGQPRFHERRQPGIHGDDVDRSTGDLDVGLGNRPKIDQHRVRRLARQPHHVHVAGDERAAQRHAG
ncbi:MAG: hypothetical protein EBR23_14140, partial [Planctomycetia bacterium]|nr:hypothetical protein [Planctomycetia bacterium]